MTPDVKTLNVIETAYRATLEEQDDTIVWLTHAMKGAGGDFNVLLRGNAVNYLAQGQDASGLAFGAKQQSQPPRIAEDLLGLIAKEVEIFYVREDAEDRGLEAGDRIDGPQPVTRAEIPKLFDSHDNVWHW